MTVRPASQAARQQRRVAFTLLEVLVVVAIIVMLAGVGGYYLIQQYEKSKDGRARIDAKALAGYVEAYYVDHGDYPASIDALAQPPAGGRPYAPPEKLLDPWKKKYQLQVGQDATGSARVEVFTVNNNGMRLSSLDN